MIVIENAWVLRSNGVELTSVTIDGDTVVSVGDSPSGNGARRVDAGGAWLGPGLVDLHVHLRDPGQTWKEDLESGARSAAAGGFTAIVAMPNTEPPIDRPERVASFLSRAANVGSVEVVTAGALTVGRQGREMADLVGMHQAGVRVFSDDGDAVPDAALLRQIMRVVATLPGAVVAEHPEERSLTEGGHLNEGAMSALHGVNGLPTVAETAIVARDLALAADTRASIHIQHVSTSGSVELVRDAKKRGVRVTAEVTPHHLALDEAALSSLDPVLKMYPPLRSGADRQAVGEALRDGVIDAVATDHAPHTEAEKAVPFEEAPRGVIGLETAAPIASDALAGDQVAFFDRLSIAPAGIAGLARHGNVVEPGSPANLMLFDATQSWRVNGFESRSGNSPFRGVEMKGKVLATIHEGRFSFEGSL